MKKLFHGLALALLCLCACGVEPDAETVDETVDETVADTITDSAAPTAETAAELQTLDSGHWQLIDIYGCIDFPGQTCEPGPAPPHCNAIAGRVCSPVGALCTKLLNRNFYEYECI